MVILHSLRIALVMDSWQIQYRKIAYVFIVGETSNSNQCNIFNLRNRVAEQISCF